MKKRLSLRMRLTLFTSLLLTLTCGGFTAFGFYNAQTNVVDTIAAQIITLPAEAGESTYALPASTSSPAHSIPAAELQPLLYATVAPTTPFGQSSFVFMGLVIVLGSAGMYFLSGLALNPAKKLAKEIDRIDRDHLFLRIENFRGGDELQSISHSFNHMMEELEQAFARESRFSSAAAHELKTPLAVIQTNVDVLELDAVPSQEDCLACLEVVKAQTRRMKQLVNQLTLLLGTGRIQKDSPVPLCALAKEVVEELPSSSHNLSCAFPPEAQVLGNGVLLKHAFSNLLHNAIRYTPEGGQIFVEVQLDHKKNTGTFLVKDTGVGIEEADVPHIFEPFYRAEASRSRSSGGAGLGLAIVQDIVQHHGGTVSYEKNVPQGSVFKITLPLEPA